MQMEYKLHLSRVDLNFLTQEHVLRAPGYENSWHNVCAYTEWLPKGACYAEELDLAADTISGTLVKLNLLTLCACLQSNLLSGG